MRRSEPSAPPRLFRTILLVTLPAGGIRESVLGDLEELYRERLENPKVGLRRARRWYRTQALRLTVGYTLRRLRGDSFRDFSPTPRPRDVRGEGIRGLVGQTAIALRSLRRNPGFTLPALAILVIGMTGATAIFTVVDSVVLRPLDYDRSDLLVILCDRPSALRLNVSAVSSS